MIWRVLHWLWEGSWSRSVFSLTEAMKEKLTLLWVSPKPRWTGFNKGQFLNILLVDKNKPVLLIKRIAVTIPVFAGVWALQHPAICELHSITYTDLHPPPFVQSTFTVLCHINGLLWFSVAKVVMIPYHERAADKPAEVRDYQHKETLSPSVIHSMRLWPNCLVPGEWVQQERIHREHALLIITHWRDGCGSMLGENAYVSLRSSQGPL